MTDKHAPVMLDSDALRRLYRAEAREAVAMGQEFHPDKPCETRDEIATFARTMRYRARFTEGVLYHVNRRSGSFRHVLKNVNLRRELREREAGISKPRSGKNG